MTTKTFANLETSMENLQKETDALKAKMVEMGKQNFSKVAKELFDKHPALKVIQWVQYTPHFNDGDECIFGVHDAYYTVNQDEVDNEDEESWTGKKPSDYAYKHRSESKWYDEEIKKYEAAVAEYGEPALTALQEDMKRFSIFICRYEELMESLFGDHVRVKVTANGVDVEEYDHD